MRRGEGERESRSPSQSRRRECLSECGSVRGGGLGPSPPRDVSRAAAEGRRAECVCEAESELEAVSWIGASPGVCLIP